MNSVLRIFGFDITPIQSLESVTLSFSWGWAAIVLLLLVMLPLFRYSYKFEDKPLPQRLRYLLVALRLCFICGVISILAGLKLTASGWIPQKNRIALLVDSSRSMSIAEDGEKRIDKVSSIISGRKFLDELYVQTGIQPSVFSFAESVAPITHDDIASFSIFPEGNSTDISKAISDVAANLGEGNLLGMLLISDGAWNEGRNPLEALSRLKTPLYFLGVGKEGAAKDAAISLDRPPAVGYLNSMLRIRGGIKLHRIAVDSIPIEIRRNDELVDTLNVKTTPEQLEYPFAYNIPCDAEGSFNWHFSIPQLEGEFTFENNETGFLLKVVREHLKVVLISGMPSWEQSFVRSAVRGDPNITFNSWTRLKQDRWIRNRDFELLKGTTAPDLSGDMDDCDILILVTPPEEIFRNSQDTILSRVETGKMGILILSSKTGYAGQGFRSSPLEKLFPVDLSDEEWKGIPCNMVLPSPETHYGFLRLLDDPMENMEFFRTLPKFDGLLYYPKKKLGTEILLSSTVDSGGEKAPFLLHHRFGQGNIAMITGGPMWPVGFKLVPTDKTIKPYTAFMINLLKWLAQRREDAQLVLDLPSSRGYVGQPLTIRVWVSDSTRQYLDNAQVTAEIFQDGKKVTGMNLMGTSEKGRYEGAFVPPFRGLFSISVSARHQGQSIGETKGEVLVHAPTLEFENPEMRAEMMIALASATGGLYKPLEAYSELLASIKATPGRKLETKTHELRDSALVLALLLLMPLAEWIIRRTRGLS